MTRTHIPGDNNILILDDSEPMQRLLEQMLTGRVKGRIFQCKNCESAQAALESERFDALLIDRELAGQDGLEFIRTMRARTGINQFVPIVAMTVMASHAIVLEALMSGAHSVLRKPASIRSLTGHLRRALNMDAVFVRFGNLMVPLAKSVADYLGPEPSGHDIMEAMAASVFRPEAFAEEVAQHKTERAARGSDPLDHASFQSNFALI